MIFMNDCIFCRIVRGEIPALKVFENDTVIAFLDIQPINPGHTLVVPKEHHENVLSTPDDVLSEIMLCTKRIARAAMDAVDASAFNIGVNTGAEAGQVVMHTHVHIMPRFAGDGLVHWGKRDISNEEMEKIAGSIREKLA